MMFTRQPLALILLLSGAVVARADEKLKDIACRSIHLNYPAARGDAFYTEVQVEVSAPGTYFAACGWDKGYFGIQELGNGKKLAIFSVWDSGNNDRNATPAEKRTKATFTGDGVRIGRFGGEGSGGQSFFPFDWKVSETYRFLVASTPVEGGRTEFAGHIYLPAEKAWKHLVTFSTPAKTATLGGYYSFIEDFQRDKVSATKARAAMFGNGWVRADGEWKSLSKARFTGDSNPATNIDAALSGNRFRLATGGDTANTGAKLKETLERPADPKPTPPTGLPTLPEKK